MHRADPERIRERSHGAPEKKHRKTDDDIPIMSWIVPLTNTVYIGPLPFTSDEVAYLTRVIGVSLFINLLPDNEEYKKKRDAYRKYFGLDGKCVVRSFPLDIASYNIKGRLKKDQQQSAAVVYVNIARSIVDFYSDNFKDKVMYIHSKTGFMDEAYIGFAVWQLLYPHTFPADAIDWIGQNHYKMLLDDDADNKQLLRLICAEAKKIVTASKMFVIKKK